MTMKQRKFATTLLTTALLTCTQGHILSPNGDSPCGFTLKTNAHQTPDEPNTSTETEKRTKKQHHI